MFVIVFSISFWNVYYISNYYTDAYSTVHCQNLVSYLVSVIYTASVARHIYLTPLAGVGELQTIYGGKLWPHC